jgi:CMP-N,N'-diacetyllegionaminic acid synthase
MANKVYAIVPARSGSTGLPHKNIKLLGGKPLIAHSIEFAKKLISVDRVFCSTDSEQYAAVARKFGAEVPFLRSAAAASNTAMEQDILKDLYLKFSEHNIDLPDIIVWLRPTFVFRNVTHVEKCIDLISSDNSVSAARTVVESENRLYGIEDGILRPQFEDHGRSMMRRQEMGHSYKVFSTDVFRFSKDNLHDSFLGHNVRGVVTNKICGFDIDDNDDFEMASAVFGLQGEIL